MQKYYGQFELTFEGSKETGGIQIKWLKETAAKFKFEKHEKGFTVTYEYTIETYNIHNQILETVTIVPFLFYIKRFSLHATYDTKIVELYRDSKHLVFLQNRVGDTK